MDLHIKQFTVRYQGKDYGPGSVIYDVEQAVAENLIAGSNGTIAALPGKEEAVSGPKDKKTKSAADPANGAKAVDLGGLPAVDPTKTVK
ncbi:hypothetical protein [Sporomusa sp.]|uniref:hypothetical protein n=1 Tax=Sporomusa sp. TaxID=2078658 RepID=UPI002CFECD09|nr:hypothetical protein [Sporomusa sp.]HWR07757.1 hypothetical protein [Sporomusa sp.]